MKKQFEYKICLSTWWIRINITGEIKSIEDNMHVGYILISDKFLQQDQKEKIQNGIENAIEELQIKKASYIIEITDVQFQLTDFQLEGLYWASREWLAFAFERDIKKPNVSFDKINNKYLFNH